MRTFVERKTHTVESVYGQNEEIVSKWAVKHGYKIVDFRTVAFGELFISVNSLHNVFTATEEVDSPRLIVIPAPKPARLVLEETGEMRAPKCGEYFADSTANESFGAPIIDVRRATCGFEWMQYRILKVVKGN